MSGLLQAMVHRAVFPPKVTDTDNPRKILLDNCNMAAAKLFLCRLADACDDDGHMVSKIDRHMLAEQIGVSPQRIAHWKRQFQLLGILHVLDANKGGRGLRFMRFRIDRDVLMLNVPDSTLWPALRGGEKAQHVLDWEVEQVRKYGALKEEGEDLNLPSGEVEPRFQVRPARLPLDADRAGLEQNDAGGGHDYAQDEENPVEDHAGECGKQGKNPLAHEQVSENPLAHEHKPARPRARNPKTRSPTSAYITTTYNNTDLSGGEAGPDPGRGRSATVAEKPQKKSAQAVLVFWVADGGWREDRPVSRLNGELAGGMDGVAGPAPDAAGFDPGRWPLEEVCGWLVSRLSGRGRVPDWVVRALDGLVGEIGQRAEVLLGFWHAVKGRRLEAGVGGARSAVRFSEEGEALRAAFVSASGGGERGEALARMFLDYMIGGYTNDQGVAVIGVSAFGMSLVKEGLRRVEWQARVLPEAAWRVEYARFLGVDDRPGKEEKSA